LDANLQFSRLEARVRRIREKVGHEIHAPGNFLLHVPHEFAVADPIPGGKKLANLPFGQHDFSFPEREWPGHSDVPAAKPQEGFQ